MMELISEKSKLEAKVSTIRTMMRDAKSNHAKTLMQDTMTGLLMDIWRIDTKINVLLD